MGRQLNSTEDRSLREIHGASDERTKRSRSTNRDESRSNTRSPPPAKQQHQPYRGFGNICSPALEPLPDFHRKSHGEATPDNNKEQQQLSKDKARGGGGWHVPATSNSVQTFRYGVPNMWRMMAAYNSCSKQTADVGDTIVGVTNGGAYTIGPIHNINNRPVLEQQQEQESSSRRNRKKKKGRAVVIPVFMLAYMVYFIASMYINNCPGVGRGCTLRFLRRMSFQPLKENPLLGPTSSTLFSVGAVDSVLTPRGKAGWRLLTSLWLPAGLFHLLLLLFGLLSVGIRFEQDFGWLCAGLLYLIPGVGGSLITTLAYTDVASAGTSSGALLGLLGARLADIATHVNQQSEGRWQALGWCAATLGGCLCAGVMPNVGNLAHLGGCLTGFLLALLFLVRPHLVWRSSSPSLAYDPDDCLMSRQRSLWHWTLWALALALLLAVYIGLAVVLLTQWHRDSLPPHSSWCSTSLCHHLSCIPTRLWNCSSSL